jgi:hypothetical protein
MKIVDIINRPANSRRLINLSKLATGLKSLRNKTTQEKEFNFIFQHFQHFNQ